MGNDHDGDEKFCILGFMDAFIPHFSSLQLFGHLDHRLCSRNPMVHELRSFCHPHSFTSYGFALTCMGFLVTTITGTPRTAMIVSFLVNAVGFVLNMQVTTPLFIYSIYAT